MLKKKLQCLQSTSDPISWFMARILDYWSNRLLSSQTDTRVKLNCAKLLAASKASHLVVADGDRRVQEVSDLPKMLEALRLQPHPLPVSLPDGFVHQQPDLLDLGHRQALLHKHQQDKETSNRSQLRRKVNAGRSSRSYR